MLLPDSFFIDYFSKIDQLDRELKEFLEHPEKFDIDL